MTAAPPRPPAGASGSASASASASASQAADLRSEVLQEADFSQIRYSQSWEDPRCLERALRIGPGDRVLSIAASGDNSFALLLLGPDLVVSVDMSPAQCALVELKRAAILTLDHPQFLRFLGIEPGDDRARQYRETVRPALPDAARSYWDAHVHLLEQGVVHCGRLEQFFALFRRWVLPLVQSRRTLDELFQERDQAARRKFYDTHWNNRRWRIMVRLFFSEFVIGRLGRDPSFFAHVDIPSVGGHYAERTRHALVEQPVHDNWFVQYILLGRYLDLSSCHPYLDPRNFDLLRERVHRLEVHCAPLEEFLATRPPDAFSAFNLSDIFEWMSDELYERMLLAIARTATPGARLAYWNNLVLRSRPESLAHVLRRHEDLARSIHHDDRAFLYRDFQVEEVIGTGGAPDGTAPSDRSREPDSR